MIWETKKSAAHFSKWIGRSLASWFVHLQDLNRPTCRSTWQGKRMVVLQFLYHQIFVSCSKTYCFWKNGLSSWCSLLENLWFFSGNSREFQEISISSLLLSKWSTFQFLCVWFQRLSCEFSCPFPYLLVAPLRVSCQWVFESFSFTNLRVDFPFHFREFRFSFPGQGVDLPFHFREFRFSVPFQRVDFPFYFRKFHFWEFLRDLHLHFWCLHKVPSGQTISYQS